MVAIRGSNSGRSLLLPLEDEVKIEETDETLDDLNDILNLEEFDDILFDLIDGDINGLPPEPCPLVVCPRVGNVSHWPSPPVVPSQLPLKPESSTTANKQPMRITPLSIAVAPPTELPEWLVKAETFDDPTHQLCLIEVQDCNANNLELLYLHVDKTVDGSQNAASMQENESTVDVVSNPEHENTNPKVPPCVLPPQNEEPIAMKSSEENTLNTAKDGGFTLVDEIIRNHLHKLSTIIVPVLESSVPSCSNAAVKSRRKQTLISYRNIAEEMVVHPEGTVHTELPVQASTGNTIKQIDDGGVAAECSASFTVATASTSSPGTDIQQNVGTSPEEL
ncbi:uncharacterized protein LOC128717893 [Anopheles marshallii]|uniref:uncharacterized protein LOC128717893 n=1 Tax=Anopheles marshallii TaxID=1521116 RepID=UPI00237AF254|nr:uncharacterized protein LOC128717893 [Anopheles marshallii]